jgi:protein-disulfide isomerase
MNRAVVIGGVAAAVLIALGAGGVMAARHIVAGGAAARTPDSQGGRNDLMIAARTKGDPKAPILIYEVSDFQCPYCRQFWEQTLPQLEQEYIRTGKVRLTFINFPISQIHGNAETAHEFAMCAAQQSKFWSLHDLLYAHQAVSAKLRDPTPYFAGLADSARLNRPALEACVAAGQVRGMIGAEAQAAWNGGIKSTPSFVVEGVVLSGAAPIADWRPILDSMYRARKAR